MYGGDFLNEAAIGTCIKQRDSLSPFLFNLDMCKIKSIRNLKGCRLCVHLNMRKLLTLPMKASAGNGKVLKLKRLDVNIIGNMMTNYKCEIILLAK